MDIIDVSLHLQKDEEQVCNVSNALYGNICIGVNSNCRIFCTPEQALKIAEIITKDTNAIMKQWEVTPPNINPTADEIFGGTK